MKSEQRVGSKKHNILTKEFNKIASKANDDKSMQTVDSKETNAYGTSKDLACKAKTQKYNNIQKQYKND